MPKVNAKVLLLEKGAEILHRKGFNDTGIQEVLKAAGIPKGSFYYYFESKEDFGLQVVEVYASIMSQTLSAHTTGERPSVLEGLQDFFREMTARAIESDYSGCPLGNLSQEMGDRNEAFRARLDAVFRHLESEIADLIRAASDTGEIKTVEDPKRVASFLVSSWEGALLRMKLTHDIEPFDVFMHMAIDGLK